MNQYDQFKKELHDYKVKIDKEKLWQQTSHAIPQRRRRRMMLFLLLGSVGVASLWWVYNQQSVAQNHTVASMENSLQPLTEQEVLVAAATPMPASTGAEPGKNGKPQKTNSVAHEKSNEALLQAHSNEAGKNTQMSTPKDVNAVSQTVNIEKDKFAFTNAPVQMVNDAQGLVTPATEREFTDAGIEAQSSSNNTDVVEMDVLTTAQITAHGAIETEKGELPSEIHQPAKRSELPSTAPLPGLHEALHDELTMEAESSSVPVIPANKKQPPFTFSTLATIGLSSFTIKPLNETSDEAAQLLNQHVRSLEHISVDISGARPLTNALSVEAGLGWNRWTTETRQQVTTYTPFTREGVTSIRVDEQGVAHPVTGTVEGVLLSHQQLRRFTQYHTVDVVVSLRQSLFRARRLYVDAMATAGLVLMDHAAGSTLDAEGVMWKFTHAENPFTRKSTFTAGGGLQIKYYLNPHFSICGVLKHQPVHYQLRQGDQHTEWTHSTLRGNLGIRYQY